MIHAPQPPRAPLEHTPNDDTTTLIKDITEEIKHSRYSKEIKFKSFKDITDGVPITLALQDWERTFAKLHMKPSVAVVLNKILPGGNLWKWYQSQCTHLDSREKSKNMNLLTTGPGNTLNALSCPATYTKNLTTLKFAKSLTPRSVLVFHQLRIYNHTSLISRI